jgi:hypothetical protein
MGNAPYYALSMPHRNTWYVYARGADRAYLDAPLHIWNALERPAALERFHAVLEQFKDTDHSVLYLCKGMKRYAKVEKKDAKIFITSIVMDEWISMLPYYERVNINTVCV